MCGRYVLTISLEQYIKLFGVESVPKNAPDWPSRYNVAPTQSVPAIRQFANRPRQMELLRWGLVPSWSKELSSGLINARSETVNEKPSFRHAFRHQRCIIPASGFYEWRKIDSRKAPYYIHMGNHDPMAFAGIWEKWRSPEGDAVESCAILTTSANEAVASIHDRMPVILPPEMFSAWLDPNVHDLVALQDLLAPCPSEKLVIHPVSSLVNKPINDSPECIKEVET